MKKQQTMKLGLHRMCILAALFIGICTTDVSAQFNPPGSFEDTYPNVGPDIGLTSHTSAYSVYGVPYPGGAASLVLAGWDDANPAQPAGVSWRLLQPSNPTIILNQGVIPYSNVRDLEVGYLDVSGDPQMLVAYYQNGVGHMLDVYSLMLGSPALLYTNVLSSMPNYTRISIDCHKTYGAAIAWEDVNGINTIVGLASGSPFIQFSGILTLNGTMGETTVDVAFSHSMLLNVQYVYYNPTTGNITESAFDFWTAIYIPTPMMINPTINDINLVGSCRPCGDKVPADVPVIAQCPYMNIDCPGHYGVDNWAYTYTTDNNNISVRLLDLNTSLTATTVIVNNGSALPSMPINSSQNRHPFCAYDNTCGSQAAINVAWFTNFIDPGTGASAGYVGLRMDESGTALLSPPDYLTVANNPTWASMTPVLSISKSDDLNSSYMYTVFPEYDPMVPGFRLENKYPPFCINSYKGNPDENAAPVHQCKDDKNIAEFNRLHSLNKVGVFPNPFTTTFKIDIPSFCRADAANVILTDVLGNTIATFDGTASDANAYFEKKTKTLPAGSYFLNVQINGKVKETIKLTKAE